MKTTVFLHARDGATIGTAEIDTADGDVMLLEADNGEMFVARHEGSSFFVSAIPVAVIVKPVER